MDLWDSHAVLVTAARGCAHIWLVWHFCTMTEWCSQLHKCFKWIPKNHPVFLIILSHICGYTEWLYGVFQKLQVFLEIGVVVKHFSSADSELHGLGFPAPQNLLHSSVGYTWLAQPSAVFNRRHFPHRFKKITLFCSLWFKNLVSNKFFSPQHSPVC